MKYSFVRSFRIQFTIDFTFDDHIKVIASKNKRLRKSIVKNTLLNIWPLLFTCIMCYCNLFFLGGKTCAGRHEEKISWKYVKIFWILEAFRRNNITVKKICWMFLFVYKWFLPFAFFMHICKWFMDQILNFWIPILSILYTLKEKNIKYQKYWKLCSKSWFCVDIFL